MITKYVRSHKFFTYFRSSRQRCSMKKGVLRNFTKFNFVKKDTLAQVFSCEFCEISKNTFFTEHLWETASEKICLCVFIAHKVFQGYLVLYNVELQYTRSISKINTRVASSKVRELHVSSNTH